MTIDQLDALHASAARLRGIVEPLNAEQVRQESYASKWSIADVMSHLGSGAVIQQARLDAALEGRDLADDFAQPIWDEWNARSPEAKTADGLTADRAFVERVEALTDDERERFHVTMGPLSADFAEFVGLRLNEHALHTWDIEVALEPTATVPVESARVVVDSLGLITQYTGKPAEHAHIMRLRTTHPARDFALTIGTDAVALAATEPAGVPDLELPAEALIRLAYGRLDPEHTPPVKGDADLDDLRRTFPGP
jgi:uncharacterized protein (TIGR03083 family)